MNIGTTAAQNPIAQDDRGTACTEIWNLSMNNSDRSHYDLLEQLLERGLGGTPSDLTRAVERCLAVFRYGFDCLSDDDRRWLDKDQ